MIEKSCRRQDRRRLSSISTSGWHGSRFGGLATAAALIVVMILTPAADAQTCATLRDSQSDCLSSTPSAVNFISIDCVSSFYKVTILSATIYQASTSSCPPNGPVNAATVTAGACAQSNPTTCSSAATSSSCLYSVRTPASSAAGTSCTGSFFVVTTYQCDPVFSTANTTTSSSTFMDNPIVFSNVQVTIGNPSAPNGFYFFGPTNYTCSVYVPAGLEVVLAYNFFSKTTSAGSGCGWRVEISDVTNSPVAQFCNSTSPQPVSLGCGQNPAVPRFFVLRYVGDSSVGVFFAVSFQVKQGNQVTVQCGMPPFPLYSTPPTVSTTAPATTLPATTTRPLAAATTAAAAVSTAGVPAPATSTPSGNGPSTAATSGAPNLVVTTAPSNPAATSVFPTPTSSNLPAAPATGNAVTSGAMTNGGVTTAALNPVVTTAPSNNVPTSALPTPADAVTTGAVPSLPPTGMSVTGSSGGAVSQPSTPATGGAGGWDQNATIGVVTGSVVAGAIVLTIVAAVALWRRRSIEANPPLTKESSSFSDSDVTVIEPVRSTNYQLNPPTQTGPYRNVTGFYVDGNSRSNLVISRQPPPPPQPFKTVLRLQ